MLQLSVLDFGIINPPDYSAESALADMLDLVTKAEEYGYKRFWLAEHFTNDCAWAFPEMLLPLMAGLTSSIKIGVAGVLLNYQIPYQIACNYRLLSYLYPGRIDLGIARGGISKGVQAALKCSQVTEQSPGSQMQELYELLQNKISRDASQHTLPTPPEIVKLPDIWQLCSSEGQGLEFAKKYQTNLCVSLIHQSSENLKARQAIHAFKNSLPPSANLAEVALALNVICSEDRAVLAKKTKEIKNGPFGHHLISGNAEEVQAELRQLQREFEVNEFVIFMPFWEPELRLETLFNLSRLLTH